MHDNRDRFKSYVRRVVMRRNYHQLEDYILSQMLLLWTKKKPPPVVVDADPVARVKNNKNGLFLAFNGALAMTGLVSLWLQRKERVHAQAHIDKGVHETLTKDRAKHEKLQQYLQENKNQQGLIDQLKTEQMRLSEKLMIRLATQQADFQAQKKLLENKLEGVQHKAARENEQYQRGLEHRLRAEYAQDVEAQIHTLKTQLDDNEASYQKTLEKAQAHSFDHNETQYSKTLDQLEHVLAVQADALAHTNGKLARSKALFDDNEARHHQDMHKLQQTLAAQTKALEQAQGELAHSKAIFDQSVEELAQQQEDTLADLEEMRRADALALQASQEHYKRDMIDSQNALVAKQIEYSNTIAEMQQKHEIALHQQAQALNKPPEDPTPIIAPLRKQIRELRAEIQNKDQRIQSVLAAKHMVDEDNTRLRHELAQQR